MSTKASIVRALEKRFGPPTYSIAYEVRSAVGFGGRGEKIRSADAMAMANWESRGCHLFGFEIKLTAADFRRELAHPEKSGAFAAFCRAWYLVTIPEVYSAVGAEVPASWGVLVLHGDTLVQKKTPVWNDDAEPWPRLFVASLIRAFCKQHGAAIIQQNEQEFERIQSEKADLERRAKAIRDSGGENVVEKMREIREARDAALRDLEHVTVEYFSMKSPSERKAILDAVQKFRDLGSAWKVRELRLVAQEAEKVASAIERITEME